MEKKLLAGLTCGVMMLGMAGVAQADLIVTGTTAYANLQSNLIYDTDLDITWLDYTNEKHAFMNQVGWRRICL